MKLCLRLQTIANLIAQEKIVTDVGSDHCYLLIHLLLNKKITSGYAIENKIKPFKLSKTNVISNNLVNNIEVILNEGIENLSFDSDCLVIAGLGVKTIIKIIEQNKDWYKNQSLIFCPSDIDDMYLLRTYMIKNNYFITHESLILENKYFYFVIKAIPNTKHLKINISDEFIYLGNQWDNLDRTTKLLFINRQIKHLKLSKLYNVEHKKMFDIYSGLVND